MRYLGYLMIASPFVALAIIGYALGGPLGVIVPFGSSAVVCLVIAGGICLIANG